MYEKRSIITSEQVKYILDQYQVLPFEYHHSKIDRITNLIRACHDRAYNAGWWHNPETLAPAARPVPELLALIHSELSEAYYGLCTGGADDKLPQYKMMPVEYADALIRALDLMGGYNMPVVCPPESYLTEFDSQFENPDCFLDDSDTINTAHFLVSQCLEAYRKNETLPDGSPALPARLVFFINFMLYTDSRLPEIVAAKLDFNDQREDHKIENRAKADGKKI